MPHDAMSREMQDCIQHCHTCQDACLMCAPHCLGMGGEHAGREHQTMLHDCADICGTAARFMGRGSHHHAHVCRECAEICNQCADACERLGGADAMMKQCAAACRTCAASCERMAAAGV
jgi:hypothetical protein